MTIKLLTLFFAVLPTSLIIVRRLGAVISKNSIKLGKTTAIITEIPGIFTKKELMVRTILYDKHKIIIEDNSDIVSFENTEKKEKLDAEIQSLKTNEFIKYMAIASNICKYRKTEWIEEVLIEFFKKCNFHESQITKAYEIIEKIPTSLEKKISTTVVMRHETKEIFAFSKGHPLKLLENSTKILINDKKIELTADKKHKIKKQIETLINNGQKVIGFAFKPLPFKLLEHYSENFVENDITFIGIAGITEQINQDIAESVEKAREAGLKTYIVTSVKEKKAIAIAKELKIINHSYFESITGQYMEQISDGKLSKMILNREKDYIFTEMNHENKQRVTSLLKEQNKHIVFIKKDEETFQETIENIQKGRLTLNNYYKFASHAITFKIAESILIVFAIIFSTPLPLSIPIIIVLDISVNTILEFALRADQKKLIVMTADYKAKEIDIPKTVIKGLIFGFGISLIYLWEITRYGWTFGESISTNPSGLIISLLIITQIIFAYALKSKKSKNIYLPLTSVISILVLYILISFKPFAITTLTILDWQIIYFLTFVILLSQYLKKIIFVSK